MTLRSRLLALTTLLTALGILCSAGLLAYTTWQTMAEQAREDGMAVAGLLARTASVSEQVPIDVEVVIGDGMLAQAYAIAHPYDLARRAGVAPHAFNMRLQEIAARTGLDEIWITDATVAVVASSLPEIDASLAEDAELTRAPLLQPLLTGQRFSVVSGALERTLDGRTFKYAGVRAVGHGGMVLVGHATDYLEDLRERVGLRRMLETLLSGGTAEAIWVFDERLNSVASASLQGMGAALLPSPREREIVDAAMTRAEAIPFLGDHRLSVVAPILDADGLPSGALLIRLPTERLDAAIRTFLTYVGGLTALLLAAGVVATVLMARYISRPIMAITRAAGEMEAHRFTPALLEDVTGRRDELGRLARVFAQMAREVLAREEHLNELVRERTRELEAKNRALETAHKQMEEELAAAQALQAAILPHNFPRRPSHECLASMVPARQLGGDFYDFFMIDGHRLGVMIADVSGKGVSAAFFMAISRTVLQSLAKEGMPAGACLQQANDLLCQTNPMQLFVTVFYGILDTRTGTFEYANGGHNPPCWMRADGTLELLPSTDGVALGVMDGLPYESRTLQLAPGDTVFLYTDGISEAMDPEGNEFTEARLLDCLRRARHGSIEAILHEVSEAVRHFAAGAPQSDDMTCLILRYLGGDADSADLRSPADMATA